MRKLVLLFWPVLLLAAACKHPGSSKLEGRWRGQKADGIAETVQLQGNAFARETEIIAAGNQIAIMTPAGRNPPATYVVDKEDATTVVIHTDPNGSPETFTFNERADTMIWKIDAQRSITFTKVAATNKP